MSNVHPIFENILKGQGLVVECRACHYTGGHAANCPTQLATPEQRVRRAAHLFRGFYPETAAKHCKSDGLSDLEIRSGATLARVQKDHSYYIRSYYGDPAYGSYTVRPDDVQRGKDQEQAVIDAHLAQLPAERKPNMMEQLTLEEQLAASIAVVNYRKGQAS